MSDTLSPKEAEVGPEFFKLYKGDSRNLREILAHFPDNTLEEGIFDTVITSPPYGDMKDYGYDEDIQVGLNESYDEYLESLRGIFKQVYDLTKDTGTLWVIVNTFKRSGRTYQLPFDLAEICQTLNGEPHCTECKTEGLTVPLTHERGTNRWYCENCGAESSTNSDSWHLQDVVIWDKERALPYANKGKLRNVFEYILCFSKTDDFKFDIDSIRTPSVDQFKEWWVNYPERYHPRGKLPDNIWEATTPAQGSFGLDSLNHPAPFPPDLVEKILRLTTDSGDVVFDPFAGSGMVLAQAEAMERRPIGIEYSEEYHQAFQQLRDDIIAQWDDTQANIDSLESRQRKLELLIGSLRQTRQARELLRQTARDLEYDSPSDLGVDSVFHISNDIKDSRAEGGNVIDSEYVVATSNADACSDIKSEFSRRLSEPPLSKFGIDADLTVLPTEEVQAKIKNKEFLWTNQQLYLYSKGVHNEYDDRLLASEWASTPTPQITDEYCEGDYPAIISNRGLKVPRPTRDGDRVVFPTCRLRVEAGPAGDAEPEVIIQAPTASD